MMQANLELHIDELVIEGLPQLNRAQLAAVVQQELARLFAERGIPPAWHAEYATPVLDGGALTLQPGASTAMVGSQIAAAVYGGTAP